MNQWSAALRLYGKPSGTRPCNVVVGLLVSDKLSRNVSTGRGARVGRRWTIGSMSAWGLKVISAITVNQNALIELLFCFL